MLDVKVRKPGADNRVVRTVNTFRFFSKHGVDVPVKFFVEPKLLENGHIQQKYSKLTADTHTSAQYILHVDSDLWYHSWNEDCFFSPTDHRPIVEFDSWDHLTPEVEQWRNGSERLLKLPVGAIKFEYSRANQHVYPRSLYRGLRSYLETRHGKSFEKIFKETPLVGTNAHLVAKRAHGVSSALLVSDFNLIGAFAHYFAPRSVHFVNLGSPSKDDPPHAECVSQCNLRLFSPKCCLAWFNAIEGFEAKEDASRLHEFSQTFFANSDQCNSNNLH